ncbi:hypothetical protein Tco_0572835 [Tanacetum coccineum]
MHPIGQSQHRSTRWQMKKAQGMGNLALKSLKEQAQTSHQWIASLAIRLYTFDTWTYKLMEGELALEELPWTLLAYLRISQSC